MTPCWKDVVASCFASSAASLRESSKAYVCTIVSSFLVWMSEIVKSNAGGFDVVLLWCWSQGNVSSSQANSWRTAALSPTLGLAYFLLLFWAYFSHECLQWNEVAWSPCAGLWPCAWNDPRCTSKCAHEAVLMLILLCILWWLCAFLSDLAWFEINEEEKVH